MIPFLADTNISGEWLTAFVVAIITAFGAAFTAFKKGVAKGESGKITLGDPVPDLPVKRVYSPPSFSQHMDLVRRVEAVESNVAELRRDQAQQFRTLLEVGEERKDKIFEKIDTMARGFHARVDQIMDDRKHPQKEGN